MARIVHALATRSIDGFILCSLDLPESAHLELLLSGLETELPPFVETISLDFVVRESTTLPREDPL